MRPAACICAFSPDLDTATRVVIFMHCSEQKLSSNTARLARKALRRCEIRVRGAKDVATDVSGLFEPRRRALVLFPSEDARPLSPELMDELPGPYTLIVPDGSWRQASRCVRRIAELMGLSVHTVSFHRRNIRRVLGIESETGLVRAAVLMGVGSGSDQEEPGV